MTMISWDDALKIARDNYEADMAWTIENMPRPYKESMAEWVKRMADRANPIKPAQPSKTKEQLMRERFEALKKK